MRIDNIVEIGIDNSERLYIKPQKERFTLIYRTGMEVHWDNNEMFLYSPKPREWTYLDWYRHIINTIEMECRCKLVITEQTIWSAIPPDLKNQINEL